MKTCSKNHCHSALCKMDRNTIRYLKRGVQTIHDIMDQYCSLMQNGSDRGSAYIALKGTKVLKRWLQIRWSFALQRISRASSTVLDSKLKTEQIIFVIKICFAMITSTPQWPLWKLIEQPPSTPKPSTQTYFCCLQLSWHGIQLPVSFRAW